MEAIAMLTRTKRETLTFRHPFSLKGVDRRLAAGEYEVATDEELIEGLSFPVYRRVATMILLPAGAGQLFSIEMVDVDPADLAEAHERDQAVQATATSTVKPRAP
jgi:hypothetical protein